MCTLDDRRSPGTFQAGERAIPNSSQLIAAAVLISPRRRKIDPPLPVPPLDPRQPSTSFKVRGAGLRVDLLTTVSGRRKTGPVPIPRLRAAAQPLPFLDFILEHPVRGAVVNGGGVLVNVPDPARFALHKLIVAGERDVLMHAKREKDLHHSAQLLSLLVDGRPGADHSWTSAREEYLEV